MRLVLVFSGILAAVAAAGEAPRGTLLSTLTGRVDDAAAADRDDDEFADAGRRAIDRSLARAREDDIAYNGCAAGAHASDAEPPREEHDRGVPGV